MARHSPYTTLQINSLQGIYVFDCVSFYLMIAMWCFNMYSYIWPDKSRSRLISLFYVIVIIDCVTHAIYYTRLMIYPEIKPWIYEEKGIQFFELMEVIGSFSCVALGWLVSCTMYQLTSSIRVIFKIWTENRAQQSSHCINLIGLIMALVELGLLLSIPLYVQDLDKESWAVTWILLASYSSLAIAFSIIMGLLTCTLNKRKSYF